MANRGILLGDDGDLLVHNSSMVLGETEMQEVAIILTMNQGEQKMKPILGANLIEFSKTKIKKFEIEDRVRIHLAIDGKDYQTIKNKIQTTIK